MLAAPKTGAKGKSTFSKRNAKQVGDKKVARTKVDGGAKLKGPFRDVARSEPKQAYLLVAHDGYVTGCSHKA